MWLTRLLDAVTGDARPSLLLGGESYGVPYLIDALRERERLAWLSLEPRVRDDPVGQGNALAGALNDLTGEAMLAHALPYRAHLRLLRQYRSEVQPLWIAVSNAQIAPAFASHLLELAEHGYRLLLEFATEDEPSLPGLERCHVLGPEALRVRRDEAELIVPRGLGRAEYERIYADSGGRFNELVGLSNAAAKLPRMPVPSPSGPMTSRDEAQAVDVPLALLALQREGRPAEALELAVRAAPERVEDVLRTAGPAFQDEGALPRLHLLLSSLPRAYRVRERTLEWRLVAAVTSIDWPSVAEEVDAHLRAFEAPDLRARRAGSLLQEEGFASAEAAWRMRRTPLTAWQYGRLHPNRVHGAELLGDSVRLAEERGTPYDVARNAGGLATRLVDLGRFREGAAWAQYALQVFDRQGLRDGARRLRMFNDLAVARILTGDLAGLRRGLEDAEASIEGSLPDMAAAYRSTLAWFEQASGRPERALALMRATYDGSPRPTKTRFAYQLVRCLLEFGHEREAMRVAAEATDLAGELSASAGALGRLAQGMVRCFTDGDGAADDVLTVLAREELTAEQRATAALHFLLVEPDGWQRIPADVAEVLGGLHPVALRVLSGPASLFQRVWDTLVPVRAELRLEFLGRRRCRLGREEVPLSPRLAEVALALALHPDGMTREQLVTFLSPDGGGGMSASGMRATLTRLRGLLPVSDAPYRWTVGYTADILDARRHLAANRVREAITLLRGPLLPHSEAHGVEEQRWVLEEELRQAALATADPDALFDLADRLGDDPELWNAAVAALPQGDPRRALARARLRRVAGDASPRSNADP